MRVFNFWMRIMKKLKKKFSDKTEQKSILDK